MFNITHQNGATGYLRHERLLGTQGVTRDTWGRGYLRHKELHETQWVTRDTTGYLRQSDFFIFCCGTRDKVQVAKIMQASLSAVELASSLLVLYLECHHKM